MPTAAHWFSFLRCSITLGLPRTTATRKEMDSLGYRGPSSSESPQSQSPGVVQGSKSCHHLEILMNCSLKLWVISTSLPPQLPVFACLGSFESQWLTDVNKQWKESVKVMAKWNCRCCRRYWVLNRWTWCWTSMEMALRAAGKWGSDTVHLFTQHQALFSALKSY